MHLIDKRQNHGEPVEQSEKNYDSLVARLRSGNRDAAGELVDLYYTQIYLYMRRFGYSSHISEDLTQETFSQIWQHIGQLRSSNALKSWVYRVACNVSSVYLRKNKRKEGVSAEKLLLIADRNAAVDVVEYNEQVNRLRTVIAEMPVKFSQAIILHYMQCLNISEAAKAAGVREGTLKSRLSRGLNILRKQLDERQNSDG